jgi:methionine synthase II (cobalamin-independent)
VQVDEPYLQVHPTDARSYGIAALQRALDGIAGTTVVHICVGYGAMVKDKPARYDMLSELASTTVQQVSVETAQSALDCSVLADLGGKTVLLGVLDLSTSDIETPEVVADRIRCALPYVSAERLIVAPDCGRERERRSRPRRTGLRCGRELQQLAILAVGEHVHGTVLEHPNVANALVQVPEERFLVDDLVVLT